MKFSTFIIILAIVQTISATTSSLKAQSANLSLNLENVQVKEVFKTIEKQTDYRFFYTDGLNGISQKVSVNVKNESIDVILSQALASTGLGYKVNNKTIVIAPKETLQQQGKVTGIVVDENGEILIGVFVKEKGTSNGATSGTDGKFSITLSGTNPILEFSYLGYAKKEVPVGNQLSITVTLKEDTQMLDEVVVVGYGTQRKASLTNAVTVVSSKDIENKPIPNAVAALQGTAPGVVVTRKGGQPGNEGYSTQIRGWTSVNGAPTLVMIDGVVGTMSNLNPNDIESINVLKDGSAAAIYGSRAAGGVILITTKKGKVNTKAKFEYNGLYSMDQPYGLPGRLNSWEELDMENIARVNAANNPASAIWSKQEMEWAKDPNFNYSPSGSDYLYYYNTDYNDALLKKTAANQNHSLSISGGTASSDYRFSLGFYDKAGILKYGPDDFRRFNALMNYNTQFSKKVSFSTQVAYMNSSRDYTERSTQSIIEDIYTARRIFPLTVPNTDYAPNGGKGSAIVDYVILKNGGSNNTTTNQIQGTFNLTIKDILDLFKVQLIYSPRGTLSNVEKRINVVPRYGTNGIVAYVPGYTTPTFTRQRNESFNQTINLLANFNKVFNKKHYVDVLGGILAETYDQNDVTGTATDLFTTSVWSLKYGDNTKNVLSDNLQQNRLLSYIGRVNYSFEDRYLFEASFRYDGSSRLAKDNRWAFFPSLSAGWNISQESFYGDKLKNILSNLKLRATWAQVGNDYGGGNYDYISSISRGNVYPFNNTKVYSYYESSLPAITRKWETLTTSNFGFDYGFFKNRLYGSFDYFLKKTTDMMATPSYPTVIGIATGKENIAEMKTWGWELEVNWRDNFLLNSRPFDYSVGFSIWDSQNKITKYLAQKAISAGINGIIEGMPINTIYGYRSLGYFQSWNDVYPDPANPTKMAPVPASRPYTSPGDLRYEDIDKSGIINGGKNTVDDHGDLINLGNTSPRYSFGLNLSASWNGFDLSALIQGVGKRKLLLNPSFVIPFSASWYQPYDIHRDYWREDNPNAMYPRLFLGSYNREVSDKWIQNAAYARLKNLQVGYTIPKSITSKIRIQRLRVFFTGENLCDIMNKMTIKLYDPETPDNSSSFNNAFIYPLYRSYAFGLNLTF